MLGDAKINAPEELTKLEYKNEIRLMDEYQFYLKYSRQITHLEKYVLFQTFLQELFVYEVKGNNTNKQKLET